MRSALIAAVVVAAAGLVGCSALPPPTVPVSSSGTEQISLLKADAFRMEPGLAPRVDHCAGAKDTRFTQCRTYPFLWNLRQGDPVTGPPVGTAGVTVSISEQVNPKSRVWNAHYVAEFGGMGGIAAAGVTATVVAECRGACSAPPTAAVRDAPVVNGSVLEGDVAIDSQGPGVTTSSQIIDIYMTHPGAVGVGTTAGSAGNRLGPVRCDPGAGLGGGAGAGCVFPEFTPTLVLNTDPRLPAPLHAAFVAAAQSRLPDRLGHPAGWAPLHRQANKEIKDKNRSAACKDFVRNTPPLTKPRRADSCDEYPYAGTKESAPGVSQVEHVPLEDNRNAGIQYSIFIRTVRLVDGDAFYVDPNVGAR